MNDSDNIWDAQSVPRDDERVEFLAYCCAMDETQARRSQTEARAGADIRRGANLERPGVTSHAKEFLAHAASPQLLPFRDGKYLRGDDHVKPTNGVTAGKGDITSSKSRNVDQFESAHIDSTSIPRGSGGGGVLDANSVSSSSHNTVGRGNLGFSPRGKLPTDVASDVLPDNQDKSRRKKGGKFGAGSLSGEREGGRGAPTWVVKPAANSNCGFGIQVCCSKKVSIRFVLSSPVLAERDRNEDFRTSTKRSFRKMIGTPDATVAETLSTTREDASICIVCSTKRRFTQDSRSTTQDCMKSLAQGHSPQVTLIVEHVYSTPLLFPWTEPNAPRKSLTWWTREAAEQVEAVG